MLWIPRPHCRSRSCYSGPDHYCWLSGKASSLQKHPAVATSKVFSEFCGEIWVWCPQKLGRSKNLERNDTAVCNVNLQCKQLLIEFDQKWYCFLNSGLSDVRQVLGYRSLEWINSVYDRFVITFIVICLHQFYIDIINHGIGIDWSIVWSIYWFFDYFIHSCIHSLIHTFISLLISSTKISDI